MRCDSCGVNINCKTDICPLCHKPLSGDNSFEEAFPKRCKRRALREIPFTKLYCIIAFTLTVIAAILNNIFASGNQYWIITAGALIYLYYCIRITFLSYRHFNMKIFGQTAALTGLGIVLHRFININLYIYEIVLPVIYIIAIVVVFINILMNINNARSYLVSFMLIAVLGVIPLLYALIKQIYFWPAILVSIASCLTLMLLVIIARKKIAEEFTRIFHR